MEATKPITWVRDVDAPLASSRFNEYRSPIKVMEAAARGIPVVASKFGPYASWLSHGYDGLLCETPKEWEHALRELISSPDLRLELGLNARRGVERFTYDKNAWLWDKAYKTAL